MLRQMHACSAARNSMGVLLLGPSGIGKSDLLLRLIHAGYDLVADDRVVLEGDIARAPQPLAGLIEIRGLGIVRMPYVGSARITLVVRLVAPGSPFPRMPEDTVDAETGLRLLWLNPMLASAVARIDTALDCLAGRYQFFSEEDKTLLSDAEILL